MNKLYGYNKKEMVLPKKLTIPVISDEELIRRYQILKPIVRIEQLKYFIRDFSPVELKKLSYILNRDDNKTERIEPSDLEPIDEFICLHTMGYCGLFRPLISEVLAQATEISLTEANAFEIIESPRTEEDFTKYSSVLDDNLQLSKVKTYKLHRH